MNWQQRNRHAEKGCQENHPYFGRVARHGEADELADVVEDATAFTHGGDDGRKIVILVAMVAERTATVGTGREKFILAVHSGIQRDLRRNGDR
jgi:hypothetical protein